MKKIILLIGLVAVNLLANGIAPIWYPIKSNNIIIGYGDGASLEEAKLQALENIKKNDINTENIKLNDLEIKKYAVIEDHFYLKMQYSRLSFVEQLKNAIEKSSIDNNTTNTHEINKYLINTKLLKELNTTFGYFPNVRLDTQYLYYQDERFLVKDDEFSWFLADINSSDISLDIKTTLKNGEKYFIKLNPLVDGYTTLMQLSNNTDVEILFANKIIPQDKDTIFPNFKLSDGLEIVLQKDTNQSQIMTMAVVCQEQKDFSSFNNMFFSISTKKYMLGEFIDEIEDCKYKAVLTTIQK
jgi:hypothetical protein